MNADFCAVMMSLPYMIKLWEIKFCSNVQISHIVQSIAVITRFNFSRYYILHCDDNGRTQIRLQTQKKYPIPAVRILEKIARFITAPHCNMNHYITLDISVLSITWYETQFESKKAKNEKETFFTLWTHRRHPIPRPQELAVGRLFWVLWNMLY